MYEVMNDMVYKSVRIPSIKRRYYIEYVGTTDEFLVIKAGMFDSGEKYFDKETADALCKELNEIAKGGK